MRRKWLVGLLATSCVLALCSCGRGRDGSRRSVRAESEESTLAGDDFIRVPDWIYGRKSSKGDSTGDNYTNVNFYYDNTRSIYPFVCNAQGKSDNTVSGTMVGIMSAMREILQQDKANKSFTLQKNAQGRLEWKEFTKGTIHDHFGSKSFYTFDGSFPREGGAEKGPLAQLYFGDTLDANDVNIVLTDLAEQGVNNTVLASAINNNVLIQEGAAAGLIGFKCNYNGTAHVPDPKKISEIIDVKMNDKRQLYLIVTGPAAQTKKVYDQLIKALNQQGLAENKDYFGQYQEIGSKVVPVTDDQLIVGPTFQEMSKRSYTKYVKEDCIVNDTFGYDFLNKKDIKEIFTGNLGQDGYVDVDLNVYNYEKLKKQPLHVLNYYIPLYNYDPDTYEYRIAGCYEDEMSGESETDAILSEKNYLTYSYLETTKDRKTEVYNWVEGNKSDFDAYFNISERLVDGTTLDPIEGMDTKRDIEFSVDDFVDLSGCDKWLQVTITTDKTAFPGSMVAFDIPVYATLNVKEFSPVPDWVQNWNITGAAKSDLDYATHTFNLEGFFSTLFAINTNESEALNQAKHELKIADIVTVLNDLKVEKKKK